MPAKRVLNDKLFATVSVHVHEEDTAEGESYRPEEDDIPLSRRPRERIQLQADGSARVWSRAARGTGRRASATRRAVGTFDIPLPLTGQQPGAECRSSGGQHTLVFTFSNNLTNGGASLTSGAGTIASTPTMSGNTLTVQLSGVADVQQIGVTLQGVVDQFGQLLPDATVKMVALEGDTNGNGAVNGSDIGQVKSQSGTAVSAANFRQDLNANGAITASDISLVKSRSGSSLITGLAAVTGGH